MLTRAAGWPVLGIGGVVDGRPLERGAQGSSRTARNASICLVCERLNAGDSRGYGGQASILGKIPEGGARKLESTPTGGAQRRD